MADNMRNYLKEGQRLMLSVHKDGSAPEEFWVHSVIGEGGSTVCYEATRQRSGYVESGKLKEFYPVDVSGRDAFYCSLERLPSGQLVPCRGTVRRFGEMCDDYIGAYRQLQDAINEDPDNEILKNYIQYSEVLYGCLDDGEDEGMLGAVIEKVKRRISAPKNIEDTRRATVYVWTPGVTGKGFDKYLAEVRAKPEARPDQALFEILNTVMSLTDCIRAMHTAGLLHLDIKPSNFLVPYYSDFSINSNSVSIFDINTLHSVFNPLPAIVGTEGYTAPELYRRRADNRTDIYSIGAMLFNAIVVSDEIVDGLYRDEFYANIDQLVRHSKLMQASETNSDVRLVSLISRILKKCLAAEPSRRYECCSDLVADLQKAVDRIKRYTMTAADEKPRTDPTIIMQKLLYDHPIYESMADDVQDINVLVVGAGTYGQKFIDICLQAGQMKDKKLRVRAVSNSPEEDAELYLQFRPTLKDFVEVKVDKKQLSNPDYSCGRLHFASVGTDARTGAHLAFTRGDNEINARIVDKMLEDARNARMRYNYVFVALGSDRLNQSVAKLFVEGRVKCPVCYVSEKTKHTTREAREKKMFPVCVNEPVTPETIENGMDQMAFNTHIAWNSSMNIDVSDTCRRFLADKYSYSSSMAFVLSIKYKLHSVGIELGDDYLDAARRFSEEILAVRETDESAKEKFSALVALEHRRWLFSYITAGWTAPIDKAGNMNYAECVALGREKDPVKRTHVCIVPSGEEMPLMSEEYTRDDRAKWNSSELDLSLDPLDRLSVMLHREYRRAADAFRRARPLMSEDIKYIERAISNEPEQTVRAFRQFRFCLKNILAGVESYSRQYNYYLNEFTRTLGDIDSGTRSAIEDRLNMITKGFRCVIESNIYRDYKANDAVLVSRIPFILTYRMPASMAMAFEDGRYQNGRNEAVFANVASATLLSPPKICYIYDYNADSAPDMFVRKLGNVINYLDKRNVHTEISLLIAWRHSDASVKADVQERLRRLSEENAASGGNAVFSDFRLFDCVDDIDAAAKLAEALNERGIGIYDGSTSLFSSQLNNGVLVGRLLNNGVGYFEFDWKRKQFNQCRRCEYLKYIEDDSYIRINDMFALMNAVDNRSGMPELAEDYETLWDIYTGKYMDEPDYESAVGNWNRLCSMLSAYEDKRPPLTLIVAPGKDEPRRTYTQFMPEFTFSKLEYLVERLIKLGIIGEDSCVTGYTSDTCRLDVTATYPVWTKLSQALARHDMLLDYYGMTVNKYQNYNSEYVKLICNDTKVKDIDLEGEEKGRFGPSIKILEQLQSAGFISRLTQNPQRPESVSFTYSSPRIKKLLTSEGEILEVFIYYELLKSGYFDDVACGYEFRWEEGGVKNELDCVVVKGFRSIIIECKATHTLKLEYYHKLHSIAEHFGIGSTKVLVGNTYRKSNEQTNRNNDMQRSRGSQLNIITISEKDEIENIGLTLKLIMDKQ